MHSTAIKRLGQFFVLFREILFTVKQNGEQGYIYIYIQQSVNGSHFSDINKCPAPGQN